MKINGKHYRTIWLNDDNCSVCIIDQSRLPHEFVIQTLTDTTTCANTIRHMQVRGAPLIGATGAYGLFLAMQDKNDDAALNRAYDELLNTRPTAVNLRWALEQSYTILRNTPTAQRADTALKIAIRIADEDANNNQMLGRHAAMLFEQLHQHKSPNAPLNILTHCNAGWLATVDWGTALSGVYQFYDQGFPVHVWVDETRPRNQGAALTAWELQQHGIPHTVIPDNAAGHIMQQGLVDCCIVGTDCTTANGDVCNKIGTYEKALCAYDNHIPFYVGAPASSIDWTLQSGRDICIEERNATEVSHIQGKTADGKLITVQLTPDHSPCKNYAFDVTPAKYITGLITERGICFATTEGLRQLFPEKQKDFLHAQSLQRP